MLRNINWNKFFTTKINYYEHYKTRNSRENLYLHSSIKENWSNSKINEFSVAIIPYTYENTNFNNFKIGTVVNLEFDVIGKYVKRIHDLRI